MTVDWRFLLERLLIKSSPASPASPAPPASPASPTPPLPVPRSLSSLRFMITRLKLWTFRVLQRLATKQRIFFPSYSLKLKSAVVLFLATLASCLLLNVLPNQIFNPKSIAQSIPANQSLQQGIQLYQTGKFTEAIATLKQSLSQSSNPKEKAITLANLAQAYRQIGNLEQAIARWEQAIQIYQAQNNQPHQLAEVLTQQAQAYSHLGQHQRAITLLESAQKIINKQPNSTIELIIQGALGTAYRGLGDYEQAITAHQASLKIAQILNNPNYITTALNNLGNAYLGLVERYQYQLQSARSEQEQSEEKNLTELITKNTNAALNAYEQSLKISQNVDKITEAKALLNLNYLLTNLPQIPQDRVHSNIERLFKIVETQPNSREKAFILISLAESLKFKGKLAAVKSIQLSENALLEQAITVAKNVGDRRAESFALGSLGQFYELSQQYEKAMELSRKAQFAAQEINAADSLYRWQWQAGRILKATGKKQQAITVYEGAIATLQSIRGDIVANLAAGKELQFSFRDAVEPVYRELISLLLEPTFAEHQNKALNITNVSTKNINKALKTLELLKLAELQNFFGDECVQIAIANAQNNTNLQEPTSAIIYSVVLDDRTGLILQLPDGSSQLYPIAMGAKELQQEVDQLRYFLEDQQTNEYFEQAKKIYNILIRPLETELVKTNPHTLVFIQDGVLRKVPMSALHDGEKYLIEKYAIATTPSLNLTNRGLVKQKRLQALTLGLSIERPPFPPLPNVIDEVQAVEKILGGTKLLNQEFTVKQLQEKLQTEAYPIIHMATHGKFGVDADSTFIQAFDSRISIDQIDNALRSRRRKEPVELLTMSACQTAAGDNRSALGIAGVAVRAGVKSALASLWYISDEGTVPLMAEFYTQLRQPNITKAEALRQAQLKLIADPEFNHPAFWSPFILIGNWL